MKHFLSLAIFLAFTQVFSQKLDEHYKIYLSNGESNEEVPIILEKKEGAKDTVYSYNDLPVTKSKKVYKPFDFENQKSIELKNSKNFSFETIDPNFSLSTIRVDFDKEEKKLILKLQGEVKDKFEKKYKEDYRLIINSENGVIIDKESWEFKAITVPLKIYLTNKSEKLEDFSNNIESDVSLGLTFGKSFENYLFRNKEEEKLQSWNYPFAFLNFAKLELEKKNTDDKNDGDSILSIGSGLGWQWGYGKFGIGVLLGVDFPVSNIGSNWVFRRQPWLGFGIGYSAFE